MCIHNNPFRDAIAKITSYRNIHPLRDNSAMEHRITLAEGFSLHALSFRRHYLNDGGNFKGFHDEGKESINHEGISIIMH